MVHQPKCGRETLESVDLVKRRGVGWGASRQGDSDMSGPRIRTCSKPDLLADYVHPLHRDHPPASLLEVQSPNKRPKRSKLLNLGRLK